MSRPDRGPCMEYVGAGRPCRRAIRNTRRNSANGSSMAGNAVRIHRARVRTGTSGIFFARRSSATENNRRRSARSAGASEEATRTAHAYPGFPAQAHFGGGYSDRRRSRRSSVADAALIGTQLRRCESVDGFGLRANCAAEVAGLRGVEPPTTWFVVRPSICGPSVFKRMEIRCAGEMRVFGLTRARSVQRIAHKNFASLSIGLNNCFCIFRCLSSEPKYFVETAHPFVPPREESRPERS